jgi:corrinoid protein of di/trimethylamine methyltransferase
MRANIAKIKEIVISGKLREIEEPVQKAIKDEVDLNVLINEGLISAMDVVGKRFSEGEIFVPEMLVSAKTMQTALALLKPFLTDGASQSKGVVILATVKGDVHDIGKNLVGMMLEGAGFQVIDMGTNLTAEELIEQVEEIKPEVVGLSALLTTTMPEMQNVIKVFKERGIREQVKIVIGGAPISQKFADEIGADGYGKDAAEAVRLVRDLVGEN